MSSINPMGWVLLFALVLHLPQRAFASYGKNNLVSTFYSRPDLTPPQMVITVNNQSTVTPGYIFLTPWTEPLETQLGGLTSNASQPPPNQIIQNGPYIYDHYGDLVYSGFGSAGPAYTQNLQVADFNGQPHLTFFQGVLLPTASRGHGLIMDNTYNIVKSVQAGNGRSSNDVHEFTVLPGGTALITIYQARRYDLRSFGLNQPYGWVVDSIFQEIDIATGNVLFEWRSLDNVDPSESYVELGSGFGDGTSIASAWDYFHTNSISKAPDGNYLVSGRHVSTLYMISKTDGSIIWHLNGVRNQFKFSFFNSHYSPFAFQHDARVISQSGTKTTISLFDNASNNFNQTQPYSTGLLFTVDTSSMTCVRTQEFKLPGSGISSFSQGSMQLLSNTNPFVSEFDSHGKLIFQAQFGVSGGVYASSYRASKFDWVGKPDSTPAIFTSASNAVPGQPTTTFYASWNGATEVAKWRFVGGYFAGGVNNVLGDVPRQGFETSFVAQGLYNFGYAEAIAVDGTILGQSLVTRTFISFGG